MHHNPLPIRAAVFESEPAADRVVAGLLAAGFAKETISVVAARPVPHHDEHEDVESVEPSGSNTGAAVALGGAIGSVLGGLSAVVGVVATGGLGLLVVGPLIAAATATGGISGGFVGAMVTRGFEPEIADFYDQSLRKGQLLVAVEADDEGLLEAAEAVFESSGAVPVPMRKG